VNRLAIFFVEMLRGEGVDQDCDGGELLGHGFRDLLGHDDGSADGRHIFADETAKTKLSVPT
jgi:hypothetical protein